MTVERLQKILARAGIASRRHAEALILAGRVAVDGKVIQELGTKANPLCQQVTVDGSPIPNQDRDHHLYLALNKPPGVIVSRGDPFGRPEISAYLPCDHRLFPVGRLDARSEGLLLLTTDGDFALRVTHPRYGCEKEYLVWTQPLNAQTFQSMRAPIPLTDGIAQFRSVRLVQRTATESIVAVVLSEGRKREIRRMFEAWTLPVFRLQRIRIGTVRLGNLPLGHYRPLTDQEVTWFLSKTAHEKAIRKGHLMVPLASTIAIDGPAGAGKTTIGKRVAGQLGYSFLDTGVMYRTVALLAHRYQVDPQNETSLVRLITEHRLETLPPVQSSSAIRLLLDGEDVTSQLRTIEVDSLVSHVSKWPAIRQKLAQKQRELALQGKFVLAGRDIGTIVLPDADLKIFLTASLEERVARRLAERRRRDPTTTAEAVRAELLARDTLDSNRETSPLQIAADAHILDTTHMSIEEAVAQVLSWAKREKN